MKNPIWFFDATGGIIKNVSRQKKPFLYSLVMHDPKENVIVPFAEFITTSHTTLNISKYLLSVRDLSSKSSNSPFTGASIIITDLSWALITAVIQTFMANNVVDYLTWSFDLIVNDKSNTKKIHKSILIFCSTHFLKKIIEKSKKISCSQDIRIDFIHCFTLLQSSCDLSDFETLLFYISSMFTRRFLTESVIFSINELRKKMEERIDFS